MCTDWQTVLTCTLVAQIPYSTFITSVRMASTSSSTTCSFVENWWLVVHFFIISLERDSGSAKVKVVSGNSKTSFLELQNNLRLTLGKRSVLQLCGVVYDRHFSFSFTGAPTAHGKYGKLDFRSRQS